VSVSVCVRVFVLGSMISVVTKAQGMSSKNRDVSKYTVIKNPSSAAGYNFVKR